MRAVSARVAILPDIRARAGAVTVDYLGGRASIPRGMALFARAAEETAAAVEDAWVGANLLRFGEEQVMLVSVALAGLEDWVNVRSRLARVPVISAFQLKSMRRTAALVELAFIGDEDQLADSLAQRDLMLEPPAARTVGLVASTQIRGLRLAAN